MVYGRPSLSSRKSSISLPDILDEERSASLSGKSHEYDAAASTASFFLETSKLARILDKILGQIYDPWKEYETIRTSDSDGSTHEHEKQISYVVDFDAELDQFEASLPEHLQWTTERPVRDSEGVASRQRNVLRTRSVKLYPSLLALDRALIRKPLTR